MTSKLPSVVGIADHTAWSIFVTLAAGDNEKPIVVDRRRVATLDAGVPTAPYHHESTELPLDEAEQLVKRVKASAFVRSRAALRKLRKDLAPGYQLECIAIRDAPGFPIPESLTEILASYRALCAADGELYRLALCESAADLELAIHLHPRGKALAAAALAMGASDEDVEATIHALGKELGPPWQKDHRHAAAAALAALVSRPS